MSAKLMFYFVSANTIREMFNNIELLGIKFCMNDPFVYASFMQCLLSTNDYSFP